MNSLAPRLLLGLTLCLAATAAEKSSFIGPFDDIKAKARQYRKTVT